MWVQPNRTYWGNHELGGVFMSILDSLLWSLRHSRKQLFESILVVVAIGLGVGVIVTVFSLLLSVSQQYKDVEQEDYYRTFELTSQVDILSREGAPLVLIGAERGLANWSASIQEIEEFQTHLPKTMHPFVQNLWTVQTSLALEDRDIPFEWIDSSDLFLNATTTGYFPFKNYVLKQGNWLLPEDIQEGNRVMVLTSELAWDLFGDTDPLGQVVPIETFRGEEFFDYTVIGVLETSQTETRQDPYFSFREARTAYVPITASPFSRGGRNVQNRFTQVSLGIDQGVDLTKAYEIALSEARFIWGEQVGIRSPLGDFRKLQQQLQNYALLIGIFASVGLIIAIINILNLMMARVLKRTKGIGLSMALGSSRRLVFRQFVLEALSLGLIGSVLGVLLSIALGEILKKALEIPILGGMYLTRVLVGVIIGFIVSLLFGVYPAYLGSKTNPVDALRTD